MFKDLKIDNKKMCNFCNFFEFYVKVIPGGYPSSRADFQSVCCEAKGYIALWARHGKDVRASEVCPLCKVLRKSNTDEIMKKVLHVLPFNK